LISRRLGRRAAPSALAAAAAAAGRDVAPRVFITENESSVFIMCPGVSRDARRAPTSD